MGSRIRQVPLGHRPVRLFRERRIPCSCRARLFVRLDCEPSVHQASLGFGHRVGHAAQSRKLSAVLSGKILQFADVCGVGVFRRSHYPSWQERHDGCRASSHDAASGVFLFVRCRNHGFGLPVDGYVLASRVRRGPYEPKGKGGARCRCSSACPVQGGVYGHRASRHPDTEKAVLLDCRFCTVQSHRDRMCSTFRARGPGCGLAANGGSRIFVDRRGLAWRRIRHVLQPIRARLGSLEHGLAFSQNVRRAGFFLPGHPRRRVSCLVPGRSQGTALHHGSLAVHRGLVGATLRRR